MNLIVGNDKSGVLLECFYPNLDAVVVSTFLRGFFNFCQSQPSVLKAKMISNGYYVDFDEDE